MSDVSWQRRANFQSFCFVRSECWLYTRGFTALLHTLHHSLPHKSQSDTAGDCATAQSSFCIRNTAGHKARNLLWGCQLNTIKMGVSAACCLPPPTVTLHGGKQRKLLNFKHTEVILQCEQYWKSPHDTINESGWQQLPWNPILGTLWFPAISPLDVPAELLNPISPSSDSTFQSEFTLNRRKLCLVGSIINRWICIWCSSNTFGAAGQHLFWGLYDSAVLILDW